MGKRLLNLYVDDEVIEVAKSKRINMSAFFRDIMKAQVNDKTKDDLNFFKGETSRLKLELEDVKSQLAKIQDERNKTYRRI